MKICNIILGLFILLPFWLQSQAEGDSLFVKSLLLSDRTEETNAAFSPEGTYLYFSRKGAIFNFGKNNNHDIWRAKREEDLSWTAPVNAGPLLNTAQSERVVSINGSADRLYFSRRQGNKEVLFASHKVGRRWGGAVPVSVPGLDSFALIKAYFVSADEQILLYCAAKKDQGKANIYYALKNANQQWTTASRLRLPIPREGDELSVFLAADNRRLFFASNGPSGGAHYDLFYTERIGSSWQKWSAVKPLGPGINTPANEYGFTMPHSGEIIAYISDVRSGQAKIIYGQLPPGFLSESNK
ncbi:MAG TPA: hypothetical protein VJ953_14825 [Saprospiraceae bacterium]|nr:hypothetical protein [Saprospiraceae bacterium]